MIKIKSGPLYQWDLNRVLEIVDPENKISEVECCMDDAVNVVALPFSRKGDKVEAFLPNVFLQNSQNIHIFVVFRENDEVRTAEHKIFNVRSRIKPADYVYEETEILKYKDLEFELKETLASKADLDENGKIKPDQLPDYTGVDLTVVINKALAQAKESGDFKGADGTSVRVDSVSESNQDGGNNIVRFTDGSSVIIKNGSKGSDGYTPQKGTDYFTAADKAEIAQMVIESFGGNPVVGYVDENNNIIVQGNIADGSYSVKYEMADGSTVNIGNLVLDTNVYYSVTNNLTQCTNSNNVKEIAEGDSYSATISANSGYELTSVSVRMGGTDISDSAVSGDSITIANVTGNIVITAVAEEIQTNNTDNILTNGAYTVELNKRWSASSKAYSTCNGMICITIPKADVLNTTNKKIYFKGFTKDLKASNQPPLWMGLDANLVRVCSITGAAGDGNIWGATGLTDEGNGVYSVVVNNTNFNPISSATQFKLNMAVNTSNAVTSLDGLTMTIDQPIS